MTPARFSVDEFQAWRDDPLTKWVFEAMEATARANEAKWSGMLGAIPSADVLHATAIELRSRIETTIDLVQCSHDAICAALDEEPTAE